MYCGCRPSCPPSTVTSCGSQELDSARAELAQLLHVSPETSFETTLQLVPRTSRDLDRLYKQAIAARPELHEQLAAIDATASKWNGLSSNTCPI